MARADPRALSAGLLGLQAIDYIRSPAMAGGAAASTLFWAIFISLTHAFLSSPPSTHTHTHASPHLPTPPAHTTRARRAVGYTILPMFVGYLVDACIPLLCPNLGLQACSP